MPKRALDIPEPLPLQSFQSGTEAEEWAKRAKLEGGTDPDSDSDDDEIQNNTEVYDEAILAVAEGDELNERTLCGNFSPDAVLNEIG